MRRGSGPRRAEGLLGHPKSVSWRACRQGFRDRKAKEGRKASSQAPRRFLALKVNIDGPVLATAQCITAPACACRPRGALRPTHVAACAIHAMQGSGARPQGFSGPCSLKVMVATSPPTEAPSFQSFFFRHKHTTNISGSVCKGKSRAPKLRAHDPADGIKGRFEVPACSWHSFPAAGTPKLSSRRLIRRPCKFDTTSDSRCKDAAKMLRHPGIRR